MKKKILAFLLTIAMLATFIPIMSIPVSAAVTITLPIQLYVGQTYTPTVKGLTQHEKDHMKLVSSNSNIVEVSGSGDNSKLLLKKPGTVTISVRVKIGDNWKTYATKKITVLQRATSVSCDKKLYLKGAGDTATLNVKLTPSNSTDVITFASSNESVATVDSKTGLVKAVSIGTCKIRVYAKATSDTDDEDDLNVTTSCVVYVEPDDRELSDFILDKNVITVPNSGEGSVVTVNAKTADQHGLLFDADIAVEKADSQYPDIITSTKAGTGTTALTIDATGITPGSYLYNISAGGKITKALTIIVGEPGTVQDGYMCWIDTNALPSEKGNYYLENDVTLSSDWTVSDETALRLNDHVLNLNGHHIIVDGSLTLQDSGETIRKFADINGLWTLDQSNGTKSVTGGVITGGSATDGGAVLVNYDASFTMDGGNIVGNNSVDYGGGVRVNSGRFTMLDGTIAGNTSARGGGVYVSGTMNMSGGTIDGNTASAYGGGIYTGTATVSVTGGLISNNKAVKNYGGGIGVSQSADVTLENCTITGNSGAKGGGVYDYGKLTINEGTIISDNTANGDETGGGGIFVNKAATLTMNGGTITKNTAPNTYGGGIYLLGTSTVMTMTGGEITGNSAKSNGGGIYCNEATVYLGGTSVIKNNKLSKNVNNLRNYGGTFSISDETPPESGMEIGFHGEGTVATNAHPGDELFFFADDSAKGITYSDGNLITVDAVAAIGSLGYASVANAIAVAKMGDTVKLLADNSESFVLPANVSFNTNGKNYTGTVFAPDYCKIEQNGNIYIVVYKGLIIEDEEAVFADSTNLDDNDKKVILDELLNNNAIENNNIDEVDGVSKLVTELKKVEATKDDNGEVIVDKVIYDVTPKNENGEEVHEPSGPITFSLPVPQSWESWEYDASQVEFRHYFLRPDGVEFIDKGVIPISDSHIVQCKFWCFSTIELTPHMHTFTGDYVDNGDGTHSCKCSDCEVLNNSENHTDANVDNICDKCGTVINKTIPTFTGMSLTLGSDISINFYMELSEEARQNGTMTFNIGGRIVTVKGTDAKYNEKEKKYYFQTPLTALEMNETVIATFNYNGVDYIQEYSVADYIEEIVGNENKYGEKAVALAKKIANYGHYAQTYLASIHKNVVIGDDGYAEMYKCGDVDIKVADAKTALENYKVTVTGELDNLSLYGSTVYFDSATALNYYVTVKDGVAPTATAVNTKTDIAKDVEIKLYKDKIYIVSIKDITATELADDIEVTINGEITLTGSVFAYCNSVVKAHDIDGATDKDIVAINAMAAFYEYHKAAVEYAETQD